MDKEYDLIVIGSGGGTKLVTPVADLGLKVAIIEKGPLGGTCLNRGCIPSKMLLQTSHLLSTLKEAKRFEIEIKGSIHVHYEKLIKRVYETIQKESQSIHPLYENHPYIDFWKGEAFFTQKMTLECNGHRLKGKKVIIGVGGRAFIPEIPGLDQVPYITYEEALYLPKKPKKLLVIGGGYIAAELGYFYASLGVETEFFVRSVMLRPEDDDIQEAFQSAFSKLATLHLGCTIQKVSWHQGTFRLEALSDQGTRFISEGDALLVATGIKPWTDSLKLENTAIEVDQKGFVKVNDSLETTQKHVYALGDCVGNFLFRHSANFEGQYLFRKLFQNSQGPIHYPAVPHAVFSFPEVAGVGLTERELQKRKIPYLIGKNSYEASARGMAILPEVGFVKLLFHKASLKLLGAHIIGSEASNMIHMLILALQMEATLKDLLEMIYIHPALPEIVRNAARNAARTAKIPF